MEKKLTKEDIKCYKMTEREIFKKFSNLSNDKLNKISNKFAYVKNTIMTNIIKHCRGEKKNRGIRAAVEHVAKLKIATIFANEKILEEYSVKIDEIDPLFYELYKKKRILMFILLNLF